MELFMNPLFKRFYSELPSKTLKGKPEIEILISGFLFSLKAA